MKRTLLLLALAVLHAETPMAPFDKVAVETHSEVTVERYSTTEGTEQIWLSSAADPAKRHLLYTHHRQAELVFVDDNAWLAINDHCGSAESSLPVCLRKDSPVHEQVTDLTDSAYSENPIKAYVTIPTIRSNGGT